MNIFEQFMNSKLKEKLYEYDEVVAIILSGSHAVDIGTNESDYDIDVFIANKPSSTTLPIIILNDKGERLHWYFTNINEVLSNTYPNNHINNLFLVELSAFTKEMFIYINPKYRKLIDNLLAKKHEIAEFGAVRYLSNEFNYSTIKRLSESEHIKYSDYTKLLFRYAFMHMFLFDSDKEFVKRLHSISTNPLSVEEEQKVIQICKDLIQYIDRRK